MSDLIFPALSISCILIILRYVIMHPFIKEGSSNTKNIVAVAIGVMLTILITHLLPEVYSVGGASIFGLGLSGLVFLFSLFIFYVLGWVSHSHEHDDEHEHHNSQLENKNQGLYTMFIGQSVHSVADGVVIASGFAINILLGIITAIAISIHHIPMMSGVVLRNNNKKNFDKLLWLTMLSSSFMFVGVILFYFIKVADLSSILISVAAASFLYVGAYDLASYLREYDDNKIFKRVLFIFLGVGIALSSQVINIKTESIIEKNTLPAKSSDLSSTSKEIFAATTTELISYIEYTRDDSQIKNWMEDIYKNFQKENISSRDMYEHDQAPYYFSATYSLATSTDYLSYVYTIYNYTGGAHGSASNLAYVVDKRTNIKIKSLEDIYKPEIYKYLEEYCRKNIKKQILESGADYAVDEKWIGEGTLATSTNYNSFWFAHDATSSAEALVIHFGQYQVAPYAAGMYDVRVPLSDLEKYSKEK